MPLNFVNYHHEFEEVKTLINLQFYNDLQKRKLALQARIEQLEKTLKNAPVGTIRIAKERGYSRYYQCTDKSKRLGTYINDKSLIIQLCNKTNALKTINYTKKELKEIDSILAFHSDAKILKLFNNIQIGKVSYKSYNFMEQMKNDFIKEWLSTPYQRKPFSPYEPEHYSMSGIRVRSKSEGKILDCLEKRNIPFLYEFPVVIDGITYHPDVKCLNPRTLEAIYWEHWGSMDKPSYVIDQMEKLDEYRKAGIILGINLFVTMESMDKPLTPATIFQFIDDYLS